MSGAKEKSPLKAGECLGDNELSEAKEKSPLKAGECLGDNELLIPSARKFAIKKSRRAPDLSGRKRFE
ncbi:hypothetical protein DRQ29_04320 [bacterium]|nr:MAG: hypothetical protein DRQ29_04320 [bacterium]